MHDQWFARWLLCAIALSAQLAAAAPPARGEVLTIQGSSTFSNNLLTPRQSAIEALSGQTLKVVSLRSDLGLMRLLGGQAQFAAISTPLERAVEFLRTANPDLPYHRLRVFPVSQVRVAFAVHPSNPVRNTDMEKIRRVLAGEATTWKELGGDDAPIRVAYVQGGGGVTLSVAGTLLGRGTLTPANPIRVAFDTQVVKVVEQEPRALGVAQLGLVKESHLPELITDRTIDQELGLVTLGEPTPDQLAVIRAVRQTAAAVGLPTR
jgi:phosphate transport system substrate-binding protein